MNTENQENLTSFYQSENWIVVKDCLTKIANGLAEIFVQAFDNIKNTNILKYYEIQKQCQWMYVKKGKKYVKVKRKNPKEIERKIIKKIRHYQKIYKKR